jgi:hypothetical protein
MEKAPAKSNLRIDCVQVFSVFAKRAGGKMLTVFFEGKFLKGESSGKRSVDQ